MAKRYCVCWIPTPLHAPIGILSPDPKTKEDIADELGSKHKITIKITNPKTEDLEIISECNGNIQTVLLTLEDKEEYGFFQYSYDADESVEKTLFLEGEIPNAIYHLIKSFYHEHTNHTCDGDSVIKVAYPSQSRINLKEDDNPALIHYLNQYEQKFIAFAETFIDKLECLKEMAGNPDQWTTGLKKRQELAKEILNALGESIYCETLLCSKYNKSYRIDTPTPKKSTKRKDEYRKSAFNIKNALETIRLLYEKNHTEYDAEINNHNIKLHERTLTVIAQGKDASIKSIDLGKRSVKLGKRGIAYCIICATAGILGSYVFFLLNPDLQPTIGRVKEIREHVDTLRNEVGNTNAIIMTMGGQPLRTTDQPESPMHLTDTPANNPQPANPEFVVQTEHLSARDSLITPDSKNMID